MYLFLTKIDGSYHVKTTAHGGNYLSAKKDGTWTITTQYHDLGEEERFDIRNK